MTTWSWYRIQFCILFACVGTLPGFSLGQDTKRPRWTSSQIKGSPEPARPLTTKRTYSNLKFNQPVELLPLANTGRMILLEVGGKVYTFDSRHDCENADIALDVAPIRQNFMRAYAIGVHPDFDRTREVFICYASGPVARPDGTRLSRFRMSETTPPVIDPSTEEVLLTWPSGGHNGCAIRFDSHGYLYFSAGDGARPYPPDEYNVSQDLSDLRATICRIDIDHRTQDQAYAIPPDNPFLGTEGARPEIWAFGLRNPWRFSFDRATDELLCGDVGWELWELVHLIERGGNYGWSIKEGPQAIRSDVIKGPGQIRAPVVAYPHTEGLSITGGYTYRGKRLPELDGVFLYGDYVTGLVWGMKHEAGKLTHNELLAETGLKIITFAEQPDGEILVVSFDGTIHRLERNPIAGRPSSFPQLLSQTGLFIETASLTAASGVFPYNIAAAAHEDCIDKLFHVAVPGHESIKVNRQYRQWKHPAGTVFAKTLLRSDRAGEDSKRIETQIVHFDGNSWQPYSYRWSQDQRDASLVGKQGAEIPLSEFFGQDDKRTHRIAARNECRACHSNQAGGAIGFNPANAWASLPAMVERGVLSRLPDEKWNLRKMASPSDEAASLDDRARSYLAANCAHCHCRGGGGTVALDLSYQNATSKIFAVDVPATQGAFGLPGKVILPGHPDHSVLMYRLATVGAGHMPKIWQRDNDFSGIQLIHAWIKGMNAPWQPSDSVLANSPTSDALAELVRASRFSSETRMITAEQGMASSNATTSGLYERLLPKHRRANRLGNNFDVEALLAAPGNARRGQDWYWNNEASQCRNCHKVHGKGASIGPDLDGIAAKRSPREILDSLRTPSEKIEPAFRTISVLSIDGGAYVGLKTAETEDGISIRSADGKEVTIGKDEIEEIGTQTQSLMPSGVLDSMTLQEAADLLAFLNSLTTPAN